MDNIVIADVYGRNTCYIDNAGATIVKIDGHADSVVATISFALPEPVEDLELRGTGNLNATGNALNNRLWGTTGNSRLDGGLGANQMWAGVSDNTYVVDDGSDGAYQSDGEGTDTVLGSVSYQIGNAIDPADTDRSRRHQRHRQRTRQPHDRQRRQQHARRATWRGSAHRLQSQRLVRRRSCR